MPHPRAAAGLWLRLLAQAAALTRDPRLCERAWAALAPHRGEWAVSLYGCDIAGPVDLWVAVVDAAQERWDDAVAGFTAARDAADRLQARPWSVTAGAGLADALAARDAAGDAGPANEFRRDGAVWRLGYGGRVVHLPDAKGLADLHLLGRPGADVPAVELLDPAAGPELVAARRLGGDPVLDEQAKDSYRRRLAELDEAIDQATGRGDDRRAAASTRSGRPCWSSCGPRPGWPGGPGGSATRRSRPARPSGADPPHPPPARPPPPRARGPPPRRRLHGRHLPVRARGAGRLAAVSRAGITPGCSGTWSGLRTPPRTPRWPPAPR